MAVPTVNSYTIRMSLSIFKDINSSTSRTMMFYCIKIALIYFFLAFPISINKEYYNKGKDADNNISE
jgi:hypothetical protein